MTRRPFLFGDPGVEVDVTVPIPPSVKPSEADYYRRAYIGVLDRTGDHAEAEQEALSVLQAARRLIKAEQDPKNKVQIPPRSKDTKPGRWRGA